VLEDEAQVRLAAETSRRGNAFFSSGPSNCPTC
jgi:hypothetical protein